MDRFNDDFACADADKKGLFIVTEGLDGSGNKNSNAAAERFMLPPNRQILRRGRIYAAFCRIV